jgi:hypothetical protein
VAKIQSHPPAIPVTKLHFWLKTHGWFLSAKQVQKQGQDDADQDASPQGEVKADIAPLEADISRQLSQPGDLGGQQQHRSHDYQEHSQNNQQSTQIRHSSRFIRFRQSIYRVAASQSLDGCGEIARTIRLS